MRKKCADFDKLTNGSYIHSYEKQYASPPTTAPLLPPHLRNHTTTSSTHPTPSVSPVPTEEKDKTPGSKPSSPKITDEERLKDNVNNNFIKDLPSDRRSPSSSTLNSSDQLIESAHTARPESPKSNDTSSKLMTSSPSKEVTLDLRVGDTEYRELYRGLIMDVEEQERETKNKIASQSEGENEKSSKKSKKKKDKKKKDGTKDKDKKKEKRRSSKASKSPHAESDTRPPGVDTPPSGGPLGFYESPIKSRKRGRSSDSNSSRSLSREKKRLDSSTTSDLYNVALIPVYPPPADTFITGLSINLNVPPPGYTGAPMMAPLYPSMPAPNEIIDDPLAAFNKHLREKDERKRREQMLRHRSPSYNWSMHRRSWSRSRSRSPGGRRGRSPRSRRARWSRSPGSPGRHYPPQGRHPGSPPPHRSSSQYTPPESRHRGTGVPMGYTSSPTVGTSRSSQRHNAQYSPPSAHRQIHSSQSPSHHRGGGQPSSQGHHHHYDRIRSRSRLVQVARNAHRLWSFSRRLANVGSDLGQQLITDNFALLSMLAKRVCQQADRPELTCHQIDKTSHIILAQ